MRQLKHNDKSNKLLKLSVRLKNSKLLKLNIKLNNKIIHTLLMASGLSLQMVWFSLVQIVESTILVLQIQIIINT